MLSVALGALAAVLALAYWLEARQAAGDRPYPLRHALSWSAAWLALGLLPIALFGLIEGSQAASSYAAVYLIERALSFDNVFVFAVLISAFEIPGGERERLVSWGALSAFALRIPAIFLGVAIFEASHFVAYALGTLLLVLAWQTARSSGAHAGPNPIVAFLQRRLDVAPHSGGRLLVAGERGRRPTPMLLCLIAIVLADITFAVDSIPAALAISHETTLLLTSNLLALLGLRALYQLVNVARERLRYMDQTIAALLALVGLKLLAAEAVHIGPLTSLLAVLVVLGVGVAISLRSATSSPCA